MKDIVSPCISVCKLDPETGYCLGCWRTRDEIVSWKRLINDEKRALLKSLHERRGTSGIPRPRRTSRRRSVGAQ